MKKITCILVLFCTVVSIFGYFQVKREADAMEERIAAQNDISTATIDAIEEEEPGTIICEDDEEEDDVEYLEWVDPYTKEDVIASAKLLWGEARGVPDLEIDGRVISSECQQAAVLWTVLNRYDVGYGDSITAVITAPGQYHGYSESNPVDADLLDLTIDVLNRWAHEKWDGDSIGRVLPDDYLWFHGDGTYNYFRNEFESTSYWTWDVFDPYTMLID